MPEFETNIVFTGPFHVSCSDDISEQFFEAREKYEVCMIGSCIYCRTMLLVYMSHKVVIYT